MNAEFWGGGVEDEEREEEEEEEEEEEGMRCCGGAAGCCGKLQDADTTDGAGRQVATRGRRRPSRPPPFPGGAPGEEGRRPSTCPRRGYGD